MAELSDDIKEKARKQIEFYFSDSNLPRDAFLLSAVEEAPDGYVSLALICTFKRMRDVLGLEGGDTMLTATQVPEQVLKGVAASLADSQLLSVSEDGTRIKRQQELNPEEAMRAIEERSLYAAPFPHDESLDSLVAVFSPHAPVNSLRMRRHLNSKDFRGSVFVEFASKEDAEKVMGTRIEHAGAVIQMEPKAAYVTRKRNERHAKPLSPYNAGNANGVAAAGADGSKPATAEAAAPVADTDMVDAAEPADAADAAAAAPAADAKPAAAAAAPAAAAADKAEPTAAVAPAAAAAGGGKNYDVARNTFVSIKLEGEEGAKVGFQAIRVFFGARDGGVKFVSFKPGDTEGFVRFDSSENAEKGLARADADGVVQFMGDGDEKRGAKIALITGDEEQALIDKASEQFKAAAERGSSSGRGGGRGGGRGRSGGRGRGGGGRGSGRKRSNDGDGGGGKKQKQGD